MMERYDKYKPSGVEWIGEMPEHWDMKRVKYIAKINPPKPSFQFDNSSDSEVVFLPMERVSESGTINQELRKSISEVSSGFTCFAKSDVILAKITPCFENGKGALLDDLETDFGYGSTEFHVLRANESVSPKFIFYITKTHPFMKNGEAFMSGSAGQKRVPSSFVENFLLGVPPSDEQTAIADYLDEKTAQVDKLIANKQMMIELLKEERAAIINQAVTKGINPKVKLKPTGIEWLGGIPMHWEMKKLKYVAKILSGFSPEQCKPAEQENALPYIKVDNLNIDHAGVDKTKEYTSEDFLVSNKPSILFPKRGAAIALNKVAIVDYPFCMDTNLMGLEVIDNKIDMGYLFYIIKNISLISIADTSTIPQINNKHIEPLEIPYPIEEEQHSIVQYIEAHTTRINAAISKIEKEIELLQEYRMALISEVVTGKIKVA